MQRKWDFQSPSSALLSSTTPTHCQPLLSSTAHCCILFPSQIVHVALLTSTLSISFLSFLSCSHEQCAFPSWVQLLQSWLGPHYSVLHTLIDCISSPQHSPRQLPDRFLHHFLVCRACLHMILRGVPHIWCLPLLLLLLLLLLLSLLLLLLLLLIFYIIIINVIIIIINITVITTILVFGNRYYYYCFTWQHKV